MYNVIITIPKTVYNETEIQSIIEIIDDISPSQRNFSSDSNAAIRRGFSSESADIGAIETVLSDYPAVTITASEID